MHTTLPRRFYTDPDFYRAELGRFYFERWICAGRADQIPRAGDYFTRTLGDESLILTRDSSGEVQALFKPQLSGLRQRMDGVLNQDLPVFNKLLSDSNIKTVIKP